MSYSSYLRDAAERRAIDSQRRLLEAYSLEELQWPDSPSAIDLFRRYGIVSNSLAGTTEKKSKPLTRLERRKQAVSRIKIEA